MTHYLFEYSNGKSHAWGSDYRKACHRLCFLKKKFEVGLLVRIITDNKKVSYWDGREFIKEIKKGGKIHKKRVDIIQEVFCD